jgi:hypothetical protein
MLINDETEYLDWLQQNISDDPVPLSQQYYETVVQKASEKFKASEFWTALISAYREMNSAYQLQTGYPLWASPATPEIQYKGFESFLLKTYRKNYLENKNWPNPPQRGWILPNNWYSVIHDILRTRFVVKYLDGVEFVISRLQELCNSKGIRHWPYYEAREEGYYAAHFYLKQKIEIPKPSWDTIVIDFSIEIQITTQIQEVIGQLTHQYYEERRKINQDKEHKWQWDYRSDEFVANYLGHILHYVEGMIMEIRDRKGKHDGDEG